ncbi:hypothetical protein [Ktedonobacter sp. SOSP1-85]|uniref:hypothetical protein n=1 Tax=Ktedonobacter sp. SOSP1-85 TaxID=2778367 RepID=UPI001915878F|nr:hypothetical protein [Ktedonobacter sp. SOSP1-85]
MPARNLCDDSTRHKFVGNLPACPVADGTPRFCRSLTGQSCHLSTLLHHEFGNCSQARGIL